MYVEASVFKSRTCLALLVGSSSGGAGRPSSLLLVGFAIHLKPHRETGVADGLGILGNVLFPIADGHKRGHIDVGN